MAMFTIHCAACGRTYDYTSSELCPRCGAYNRPPRRVRVDSDGSVRSAADVRAPRPDTRVPHGRVKDGKLCYEEKECYEQKECHEDDARAVRSRAESNSFADAAKNLKAGLGNFSAQFTGGSKSRTKGKTVGVGTIVAIVAAIIVTALPNIVNSCQYETNTPDPEPAWEDDYTEYEDFEGELADMDIKLLPQFADFTWLGATNYVTGGDFDYENSTVSAYLGGEPLNVDEANIEGCYLLARDYTDADGGISYYQYPCTGYDAEENAYLFAGVDVYLYAHFIVFDGLDGEDAAVAVELY